MLDTFQVEIVGAIFDGGIVHARPQCMDHYDEIQARTDEIDGFVPDYRRFWDIATTEFDIGPLIRFSIHEMESANWDDLPYSIHDVNLDGFTGTDYGEDADADYTDGAERVRDTETGEWYEVDRYIGVFCDSCGERIE